MAAESPAPLSHGNFAWIPRVTGSPSTPPKSSGQYPFGTTSADDPLQPITLAEHRFGIVGRHHPRGAGMAGSAKVTSTGISAPFTGTVPVNRLISLNGTRLPAASV